VDLSKINAIRETILSKIAQATLDHGGFADRPGGDYRPDVTAWAILLLSTTGFKSHVLNLARLRLQQTQLEDGRVCIAPEHPDAYWPTSLAILAWQGSVPYQQSQNTAIQFLLTHTGTHWKKRANSPLGHDPSIRGWPWIDQTHSWVYPTALAMVALTSYGLGHHERVMEAERLLLDRQLPHGGWNYGNTMVFGHELRPFPETTGVALHALAGRVSQPAVERSLEYLLTELPTLRTPMSLGWSLLGLGAWGMRPDNWQGLVQRCLERENRYGGYDTYSLCLILAPLLASKGLGSLLTNDRQVWRRGRVKFDGGRLNGNDERGSKEKGKLQSELSHVR